MSKEPVLRAEDEIAIEAAWERTGLTPTWPDDEPGCGVKYATAMADEIERLRAEPRWIPVGERMPDVGVTVLGFEPTGGAMLTVNHGPLQSGRTLWIGCTQNGKGEYEDAFWANAPTHWMPLPELPSLETK